jgi:iron complex transport system substrate-binding protein
MNKKVLACVLVLVSVLAGSYVALTHNEQRFTAQSETTEFTHALGTVHVPQKVEKIAVFDYAVLDILNELDVEVSGVPKGSLPQYLTKYQGDAYTDIGTLFEPNYELLAKMAPDVIFISGRQRDCYEMLSAIAPTVYLTIDASDYIGSMQKNVRTVSEIVHKEAEATDKLTQINAHVAALRTKVGQRELTGLILLANEGRFSAYGQASRFGIIHNTFGITPIDTGIEASTHGQTVSYEYVADKNPDYLFVIDRNRVVGGRDNSSAFENDLMMQTKAYQTDRIIFLNPETWYLTSGGLAATEEMIKEVNQAIM